MKKITLSFAALPILLIACGGTSVPHSKAVYLLVDTSGTYTDEIEKVHNITNYLLGLLTSDDSLGLARIDSASFSEKNIVSKVTFDTRPSYANQQKRSFRKDLDHFITSAKGSSYTDITGGMLQAAEWLNETEAGHKYILIFSDLEEDLREGYVRDFTIDLTGINVVALNVTKLLSDQIDPREYLGRLDAWQERVEVGGGNWKMINDLERLDRLLR
jgi:hypothetical protein